MPSPEGGDGRPMGRPTRVCGYLDRCRADWGRPADRGGRGGDHAAPSPKPKLLLGADKGLPLLSGAPALPFVEGVRGPLVQGTGRLPVSRILLDPPIGRVGREAGGAGDFERLGAHSRRVHVPVEQEHRAVRRDRVEPVLGRAATGKYSPAQPPPMIRLAWVGRRVLHDPLEIAVLPLKVDSATPAFGCVPPRVRGASPGTREAARLPARRSPRPRTHHLSDLLGTQADDPVSAHRDRIRPRLGRSPRSE